MFSFTALFCGFLILYHLQYINCQSLTMHHLLKLIIVLFLFNDTVISADSILTNEELRERGINDIYVIGDIHGSKTSLLSAAQSVGICNQSGSFIKRNIIVVQVGDMIHRGNDSVGVVRTLKQWQEDAPKYNSEVIVLRGNHEQNQIKFYHRYYLQYMFDLIQHHAFQFHQDESALTYQQFLDCTELGDWIRKLPVIQIVGNSVFVHAGIQRIWLEKFEYNLEDINQFAISFLSTLNSDNPDYEDKEFDETIENMLNTRMFARDTWDFGYAFHFEINDVLNILNFFYKDIRLNVSRIVIGHNTIEDGIVQYQNKERNKLLYVDTGFYQGNWSITKIDVETDSVLCTDCTMIAALPGDSKQESQAEEPLAVSQESDDYLVIRSLALWQGSSLEF